MTVKRRVQALEKAMPGTAQTVTVTFKPGSHKEAKECSLEKAFELARCGELEEIRFPLTYEEQQVKYREGLNALDRIFDGFGSDYDTSHMHEQIILCSKPVIMAKQAQPHGNTGGYFITADGEEFHHSQVKDLLKRRGAGTVIVENYDETKEQFYKMLQRKDD